MFAWNTTSYTYAQLYDLPSVQSHFELFSRMIF
jgi:hypothetical protein